MEATKTSSAGNFFEDFGVGQRLVHGPARTLHQADQTLYTALYGGRFAPQSSAEFARELGFDRQPLDDLLVFHTVFGKSVPEVSLNAIANLGYADCRFLRPVFAGDTISVASEVIGTRENANRESGIVYVRTTGTNQHGVDILQFVRWVMVRKREKSASVPSDLVPELPASVPVEGLMQVVSGAALPPPRGFSGGTRRYDDYSEGQCIDHVDGTTVEEAEHMLATRLYHNTARVHFNAHAEREGRFGKRIVYGGHVISVARALSFAGLENAWFVSAINGGRHVSPCFAGDTIYAWSKVISKAALPGQPWGALRMQTIATKDRACADFPFKTSAGSYDPSVILDIDYWVMMPRY